MPLSSKSSILIPLLLICGIAHADYYGSYGYPSRYSEAPIISLELDAKKSLNSAFRIAAREERLKDMRRFLKQGAEMDAPSDSGETALMYAARNCSEDVASFLLKSGAKPNLRDSYGRTALMYAVMDSCEPVVKLLLKDPKIRLAIQDGAKQTALDYAQDAAYDDVDGPPVEVLEMLKKAEKLRRSHALSYSKEQPGPTKLQ